MDIKLLQNIMEEVRENKDLLDSFSPNQFKSKLKLVEHIDKLDILTKDSEIVIFGSWYGSILIPAFYDKVKKITCIDQDPKVISKAKYKIFKDFDVDFITDDIFNEFRNQYKTANLFINTSCEHMKSMKEWGPAPEYKNPWSERIKGAYFAYQSNNMYDIEGHINCVSSIEEFKYQLPENAKVMVEDKIMDERGTRFLLVGKYE